MSDTILGLFAPRRRSVDVHPTTAEWRRGLKDSKHPMTLGEYVGLCEALARAVRALAEAE